MLKMEENWINILMNLEQIEEKLDEIEKKLD
jgi:hypothetical protein